MNKFVKLLAGIGVAGFLAGGALAAEKATKDEAVALVKKGVAHLKAAGKDKAFADFNNRGGAFVDRELYLTVFDLSGRQIAHGANEKLIGKDLSALKDADGKEFVKEFVATAKGPGKGWVDYKWPNPSTKVIEAKSTYVERVDDVLVGAGIYK